MRITAVILAALVLVSAVIAAVNRPETAPHDLRLVATNQPGLTVHEWGTFTSFSGSDGVQLEFRPLVDNDLPPFVLDRARQSGAPNPLSNPLSKSGISVLQRMETPVLYFYTDREQQVSVRVGFPQGLLTEFYPPVQEMHPKFEWLKPEPVANSLLDWGTLWVIPTDRFQADVDNPELAGRIHDSLVQSLLPPAKGNHYGYARETDSALVYVSRKNEDKNRPLAPSGDYFEKFLFYRGVGNFKLPLTLTAHGDGRFQLHNAGQDPIRSLFLVTVEGDQIRFSSYEQIEAGQQRLLNQPTEPTSLESLSEAVIKAIVAERLYEKEAGAMVKTWQESWFGEDGTRLFYMVPTRVTDQLLPLEVEPRPDELVRVLVGRLEIMTPEDEARVTEAVRQSAARRAAAARRQADSAAAEPQNKPGLPPAVAGMGRLAEPALVRVKTVAKEANVRNEAALLLRQIQAAR